LFEQGTRNKEQGTRKREEGRGKREQGAPRGRDCEQHAAGSGIRVPTCQSAVLFGSWQSWVQFRFKVQEKSGSEFAYCQLPIAYFLPFHFCLLPFDSCKRGTWRQGAPKFRDCAKARSRFREKSGS